MYPYSDKWNKYSLLFLITLLKKKTAGIYDYSTKMTRADILDMNVSLPVTDTGDIDFNYMELFMRKFQDECIHELSTYLSETGLENYLLNAKEKNVSKKYLSNKVTYKKFKLGIGEDRLFDITSTKKKFNANTVKFGGKYPYVVRSSTNNGIRGYITQDKHHLNAANTISFGQDTATIFYQDKPYFTGDKIKVMVYRDRELTPEIACYLITMMRKALQDFIWGQSSFSETVLKNIEISLPITPTGNIDYDFISNFIKLQEKLSIKDVVDWKNKLIQ